MGIGKKGHRGLPHEEVQSEQFCKRSQVGNREVKGGGEGSREWPWVWELLTETAMGKGL